MSSLETRKIEPLSGTTVTLGEVGDTVAVPTGAIVKTNTVKDSGGNTLFTSDGAGTISSVNSGLAGSMVFISSQDGSGASYIDFTSGIDSTYDEYVFIVVSLSPSVDGRSWRFQADVSGGSSYAQYMTTTNFTSYHNAANTHASLSWQGSSTQAQGTSFQMLTEGISGDSNHSASGILHLFAPSSTTYVKHFYSTMISTSDWQTAYTRQTVAGYFNTAAALTNFRFKFNADSIYNGTIYLYGIS